MTEPTPLPPTSGPSSSETHSQPASHAHSDPASLPTLASTPVASGCCGGHEHSSSGQIETPAIAAHAAPSVQLAGAAPLHSSPSHTFEAPIAHSPALALSGSAAQETVAVATVAVATLAVESSVALASTAVATETQAPLLGHAGSLTPLTDATAQDIEAALRSAQKARASQAVSQAARPKGSDLVARKVVLRRDRWDSLLKLTNALRAQRGIVASPAEVAAIVLDAGLNVILEESAQAARPHAVASSVAPAPVAPIDPAAAAPVAAPAVLPTEKVRSRPGSRATALPASAEIAAVAPVTAPIAAAPAATPAFLVKPRVFTSAEIARIRKTVRGLPSARSIQRTLGLWLGANLLAGHSTVGVPLEDLRALCREFKVYDTANFAQNMKKDSAFFSEVRDAQGDRLGYDLTPQGRQASAAFVAPSTPVARKATRATKKAPSPRATKRSAIQRRAKSSTKTSAKASIKRRGK